MDLVTLKYRISGCEDKNLLTFDDLDNVRECKMPKNLTVSKLNLVPSKVGKSLLIYTIKRNGNGISSESSWISAFFAPGSGC